MVPSGLRQPQRQPAPHWLRPVRGAGSDVAPQAGRRTVVDLDQVKLPVQVEIRQAGASTAVEAQDSGDVGDLAECGIGLAEKQVARVALGVVGLLLHVAFRDEEICEAIVVHIGEFCVPGSGRALVSAGERLRCVHARLEPHLPIRRLTGSLLQCLEPIGRLAGQVILRIPVTVEVVAGDPHPLDLD